ncbi:hypothetical protein [uncultured Algoriphagus sp.]|uniref:hypothetical protein n=1 Tax=uncultured Algoriphagus sp. TaxID=417365 RepID=UPI00259385ED|nr:hypothetical protein [uncultured Algoriphagus sp.]
METLLVKVDTKKNQSFIRELLLKFDFVLEVGDQSEMAEDSESGKRNAAGILKAYADKDKLKNEKAIWEQVVKMKHGVH